MNKIARRNSTSGRYARRTFEQAVYDFWQRVDRRGDDECWTWTGHRRSGGYGAFVWREAGVVTAHKFAWLLIHPETKFSGRQTVVMHSCDNPPCVNPNHLRLGTAKDNIQDCITKGRGNRARGGKIGCARLNDDLAKEIFLSFLPKKRGDLVAFAKKYKVHRNAITRIINRLTWRHVTDGLIDPRLTL